MNEDFIVGYFSMYIATYCSRDCMLTKLLQFQLLQKLLTLCMLFILMWHSLSLFCSSYCFSCQ